MSIDYPRFWRVIDRSKRLAGRDDVKAIVKTTYEKLLAAPGESFLVAHKSIADILSRKKKEKGEALVTLEQIRPAYDEARTAMQNFLAGVAIPPPLGSLSTPNEQYQAISDALGLIDAHKGSDEEGADGEAWAKDLAAGPFYALAPVALREIDDWIQVNGDSEQVVRDRATAYAAAYPAFLRFRNQVRASYGDKSIHYRRLIVKSDGKLAVDDIDDVEVDTDVDDNVDDDTNDPNAS